MLNINSYSQEITNTFKNHFENSDHSLRKLLKPLGCRIKNFSLEIGHEKTEKKKHKKKLTPVTTHQSKIENEEDLLLKKTLSKNEPQAVHQFGGDTHKLLDHLKSLEDKKFNKIKNSVMFNSDKETLPAHISEHRKSSLPSIKQTFLTERRHNVSVKEIDQQTEKVSSEQNKGIIFKKLIHAIRQLGLHFMNETLLAEELSIMLKQIPQINPLILIKNQTEINPILSAKFLLDLYSVKCNNLIQFKPRLNVTTTRKILKVSTVPQLGSYEKKSEKKINYSSLDQLTPLTNNNYNLSTLIMYAKQIPEPEMFLFQIKLLERMISTRLASTKIKILKTLQKEGQDSQKSYSQKQEDFLLANMQKKIDQRMLAFHNIRYKQTVQNFQEIHEYLKGTTNQPIKLSMKVKEYEQEFGKMQFLSKNSKKLLIKFEDLIANLKNSEI